MSPLWLLLGLLALTGSSESSNWGCYGNIRTMNTPGASCGIGRRYGLTYCGVRASERLAEIDRPYLLKFQPTIRVTGKKYCVDPAVIAGLLSRESQGGNLVVGMGNVGNGVGVVQSNDISVKGVTYCIQEGSGSPSSVLVTCMPAAQAGPLPGSFGVRFAALGKGITLDSTCVNVLSPGLTSLCYTEGPNVYPPTSWKSESWVSQKTETLTSIIKQVRERFPTWTPDQYLRGGLCAYSKGPSFIRSDQDLSCDFCNDVLARAKYFKNHGF